MCHKLPPWLTAITSGSGGSGGLLQSSGLEKTHTHTRHSLIEVVVYVFLWAIAVLVKHSCVTGMWYRLDAVKRKVENAVASKIAYAVALEASSQLRFQHCQEERTSLL